MVQPTPREERHDDYGNLQIAADDPDKVHLVVQTDRLGSRLFVVKLEYEHYRPRSGRNKFYDFHMVKWPYVGDVPMLLWFVVGIPKHEFHLAEQVAKEVGMEIVPETTFMFSEGVAEEFPMKGENVYTVKNNPKSLQYKNEHDNIEQQRAAESRECDRIIKDDEQRMRTEYREGGYDDEQIERMLSQWNAGNGSYFELPNKVGDGQHRKKKD